MVIVDSKEPKWIVELIKQKGLDVKVQKLDVGDYLIKDVLIERKTLTNLFNSMSTGQIWTQLYYLSKACTVSELKPLVVITGLPSDILYPVQIRDALARLLSFQIVSFVRFDIPTVHVESDNMFVNSLIPSILKWATKEKSLKPVKKKSQTLEEVKSDMLSCIPSIGRKTANYLASKFTLTDLASLSLEDLSNIRVENRRLGKKAYKIIEALTK